MPPLVVLVDEVELDVLVELDDVELETGADGCVSDAVLVRDRILVSFFSDPGDDERYVAGDRTIWSIEIPSSRCWMRRVCALLDEK